MSRRLRTGNILILIGLLFAACLTVIGPSSVGATPPQVQIYDRGTYQEVEVKTGLADYLFSTQGGVLKSVYLYFTPYGLQRAELVPEVTTDPKTLERAHPDGVTFPFRLELGGLDEGPDAAYTVRIDEQDDRRLVLTFTRVVGDLSIEKRFTVFNDPYYRVGFTLSLRNAGDEPLELAAGYRLLLGSGLSAVEEPQARYLFDGQLREAVPAGYARFEGVGYTGGGLALFLKNETPGEAVTPYITLDARGRRLVGAQAQAVVLGAGEGLEHRYLLYAGRLKYVLMERSGLQEVAGLGPFSQFLVPMIKFLDWLYERTGNYGWAIIIFTVLTRVLLFPLMRQQFHSMAKMQKLQPKMARLRERYPTLAKLREQHPKLSLAELQKRAKENREKLNRKLMELYQKEGINPLGGCLPVLVQFPILIILWRAVLYSAEAIHFSPGFLWMPDLSMADPTYLIVILTVGVMLLQSKMTPTMGAGQNQMLVWIMPLFMGFFLKDFPAGLWLYYFLTTVFQVGQQALINREMARKVAPAPQPQAAGEGAPAEGENPKSKAKTETSDE